MRLISTAIFLLFSQTCFPQDLPQWSSMINQVIAGKEGLEISRIYLGASNVNYHLIEEGHSYFIRVAPPMPTPLYASQAIEYEVLQKLSPLGICAHVLHYDSDLKAMVLEYLPHEPEEIDLKDPKTAFAVAELLHQIEKASLSIPRVFKPYSDVFNLVAYTRSLSNPLPEEFDTICLPALQKIDPILSLPIRKSLCHLDLHRKNILKNGSRLWFVDWEYAAMSHPYLVPASMAAIERWSDSEMEQFLAIYEPFAGPEERDLLYLYRIAADLFWTAWNHVQAVCSPIDHPYGEWERLFYQAALQRLSSPRFSEILNRILNEKPSS